MKIGVYGTGVVAQIIVNIAVQHGVEISFFIQTVLERDVYNDTPIIRPGDINYDSIDYLVLGSDVFRQEMRENLQKQTEDYTQNIAKIIDVDVFVDLVEPDLDYKIVKVDNGISYIYTKYDTEIGPTMARTRRNWAADVIDDLFDFAVTNTSFRPEGIFLDIGANIGTTSIYVKKNWPELDIVAFEPGKKNYDLFRANCILNGIEDYCIENIGLGEKASEGFLFYRSYNPGGSMIVSEKNEISQEQVKIKTIDEYISDNKIKPQDISFIWMDTEGFEADIIIGSQNLLGQKSVPLVHEFDPNIYERRGKLREYLEIMSNTYTYFFDVNRKENGRYIVESIGGFDKWVDTHKNKTDLFFF